MQRITPFLTFKKDGKKAVDFYCSVFKESSIDHAMTMPDSEQLLHAGFTLDGQDFMAMDGGDYFEMREGQSLFVACKDQAEVDYYWEKLSSDGGEQGECGWLTDKFGVSWQVVPTRLGELMGDPDPKKSAPVMQAMLKMKKIVISELEAAANGKTENTELDPEKPSTPAVEEEPTSEAEAETMPETEPVIMPETEAETYFEPEEEAPAADDAESDEPAYEDIKEDDTKDDAKK